MLTMQDVERRYLAENQDQACGRGNRDPSDSTKPIGIKTLSGLWIILAGAIAVATAFSVFRKHFCQRPQLNKADGSNEGAQPVQLYAPDV
jgi:hypothetical protein